jgi:hypothetical protein
LLEQVLLYAEVFSKLLLLASFQYICNHLALVCKLLLLDPLAQFDERVLDFVAFCDLQAIVCTQSSSIGLQRRCQAYST